VQLANCQGIMSFLCIRLSLANWRGWAPPIMA